MIKRLPPLPDLGKLTGPQKDELIVSLWETLAAIEGSGNVQPLRSRVPDDTTVRRLRSPPMNCAPASGGLPHPDARKRL